MNAHVENNRDDDGYLTNDADGWETYTIFVLIDGNQTQLPLAVVRGDDGPGAYGTGFTLTARPAQNLPR